MQRFSDESDKFFMEGPRLDKQPREKRNQADRHFMRFIEHTKTVEKLKLQSERKGFCCGQAPTSFFCN